MSTLEQLTGVAALGVPDRQVGMLAAHLTTAEQHVYMPSADPEQAFAWLRGSLDARLEPEDAEVLYGIARQNYVAKPPQYGESGYDSCQEHRALSKVVSEAILLGGIVYESELVGLSLSLADAQRLIGSGLDLEAMKEAQLASIAEFYGAQQDFIFPGVTPSAPDTPSLGDMAYQTLRGRPVTSVRNVSGVGGLRADHDWNHATDLPNFVKLKMTEDKRYYPGMAIFYFLQTWGADALPAVVALRQTNSAAYQAIVNLEKAIRSTEPLDYEGVSVLCAAYVPKWRELKELQGLASTTPKDLTEHFHSPSWEFGVLKELFGGRTPSAHLVAALDGLVHALDKVWSFNSTIHLSWAAELSPLSEGLIGKITNHLGDYAVRWGVGFQGKSLEIVEYTFGEDRKFPFGLAGMSAAVMKLYSASDCFEGAYEQTLLPGNHRLWQAIGQVGFLRAALEELANHE